MSDVNDTAGGYELFEALGKGWKVKHVSPGIRAAFTRWVKASARQEIADRKDTMSRQDYEDELAAFQRAVNRGDFNWGFVLEEKRAGPIAAEKLASYEGELRLFAIMLEEAHGELSLAKVERMREANQEGYALALRAALEVPPNSLAPSPEEATGKTTESEKKGEAVA